MARRLIKNEDINPTYDEIIAELTSSISRLIMENTILRISSKKLEGIIQELNQESGEENKEF